MISVFDAAQVTVTAVEGRLVVGEARLTARAALLSLSGGGNLSVDGKASGSLPQKLELTAGKHSIVVTERGHEFFQREVTLERGGTLSLHARMPRTAQRTAAYWLLGLTGAAAAATIAAGAVWGQAEASASSFLSQPTHTLQQADNYDSDRARRDSWRTGTYVALGLTGLLAVITTGLFVFDRPAPPSRE
jgi:hypothetical protein